MMVSDQIGKFTESLQTLNRFLRTRTFDGQERAVTRVQWTLLRTIFRYPGQTVGQLALRMDVRQATMSQMLDRLEKVRYIARTPSAQDARVKAVVVTETGNALIREIETQWRESLEEPFLQLSLEDRAVLVEIMGRLAQSVGPKG